MKRVLALIFASIMLLGATGVAVFADVDAAIVGGKSYASLQLAFDAVRDGTANGVVMLQKDVTEIVTVETDVYINLNGYDIENLTVTSGTCYVYDSQTADFAVGDYGVIKNYTGNVQPFCTPEEDGCGWLMLGENGTNASFHYVALQITDMVLRPKNENEDTYNPSLYYKCSFKGDEVVAQNVETFGVALSIVEAPNAENLKRTCGYTVFRGFQAGENGNPEQSTGTILKGIMKESNAYLINKRNANMPVYGRAYVELKNGVYVFGECRVRNLKEQTQGANLLWTLFDAAKKADIRKMYQTYPEIMQSWNLSGVTTQFSDVVEDAVTWYQEFNNLPVVSSDMTTYELRQLVVDFFRIQLSFKWTPNELFSYQDDKHIVPISPGTVYEGMPYCVNNAYYDKNNDGKIDMNDPVESLARNMGNGNIYKVLNYYDTATGVVDIAGMNTDPQYVVDIMTSNCSGGLIWALSRVSNVRFLHDSSQFVPANGCLPVGPYTWNEFLYSEVTSNSAGTMEIFANYNGIIDQDWDLMYQSYAMLQPGDVLASNGHVRMCSAVSEVAYKDNGDIDPENSYVWYIDQNSYGSDIRLYGDGTNEHAMKYSYKQDNDVSVHKLGGLVDDPVKGNKITFCELLGDAGTSVYNSSTGKYTTSGSPDGVRDMRSNGTPATGYVPVRIAEFCTADEIRAHMQETEKLFEGTDRWEQWLNYYQPNYAKVLEECGIEEPAVTTTNSLYTQTKLTPEKFNRLSACSLSANYPISDLCVIIEDANGSVLAEEHPHVSTSNRSHGVQVAVVRDSSTLLTTETLTTYAGKGNRVKIYTRMSTGQMYLAVNFEIV